MEKKAQYLSASITAEKLRQCMLLASFSLKGTFLTISHQTTINKIGELWLEKRREEVINLKPWVEILPSIDIWLDVSERDYQYILPSIPTLDWEGPKLAVRLVYQADDVKVLFENFIKETTDARNTEKQGKSSVGSLLFPRNLCDYPDSNTRARESLAIVVSPQQVKE